MDASPGEPLGNGPVARTTTIARDPAPTLPARCPGVHAGYALGSLATGAFGTVPGLLLLPYLTDTLGVAAGLAAPAGAAAEGVGRAGQPGRRADLRPHPVPLGRPPAVPARRRSRRSPCCSRPSSPRPFGDGPAAVAYVALAFLATATAFAFFQVPYVAMPAEMTDDYAERTRLMTWRIAVLALAILVSGAVAPLVVTAGGDGVPGHRWMGLFVAALIVARRPRRVPRHPVRADRVRWAAASRHCGPSSRWPAPTGRSGRC